MTKENRVETWLTKALDLENQGHKFYADEAEKTLVPEVAKFFKTMADLELLHVKSIQSIYAKLDQQTCWSEHQLVKGSIAPLKDILLKVTKQHAVGPQDDLVKAIEQAIKFETEVGSFYEKQISQADCEGELTFLQLMVDEENEHRLVLDDMKMFYTDPTSWMQQQEHGHLDGA